MYNTPQLPPILDFNENSNKGTLFDTRDGQSYPVVRIGNQIWLAENFRYLPKENNGNGDGNDEEESPLYKNGKFDNDNQFLFGRYYNYKTATKIAPEGWHLPTKEEFNELFKFILIDNKIRVTKLNNIERHPLISPSLTHNKQSTNNTNNNDKYGFNLLYSHSYYKPFNSNTLLSYFDTYIWCQNSPQDISQWLSLSLSISNGIFSYENHPYHNNYLNVRLIKN